MSREEKIEEVLRQLAAQFLQRESNRLSLITVTHVGLTNRGSLATVYLSVLPETMEQDALDFTHRKRTEFREFIKEKSKLQKIPRVDFAIDIGEKNRQKIDELSLGQ